MNDLEIVAGLRADVPEPPSARLAEGRARLTAAIRADTGPVTPRSRRMRLNHPALAIGAGAAAAATAAAAVVLTGGPAVPGQHGTAGRIRTVVTTAWTVREDAGGTVTIYLREYANPSGLQQTLLADGVNAIVRRVPQIRNGYCYYATGNDAPPAVQQSAVTVTFVSHDLPTRGAEGRIPVFIIRPREMPPGSALFLPFTTGQPVVPTNGKPQGQAMNGHAHGKALWPVVLNNDTVSACVAVVK